MASQVIYYVAMSLDGFIAEANGSVDWLEKLPASAEDLGYDAFFETVGAVVMGSTTYEQILGFGDYPYTGVESVVMTTRTLPQPDGASVTFSAEPLSTVIGDLRSRHEKSIWVVGGGKLAAAAEDAALIDVYDITVMPVLLRAGVPLLAPADSTRLQHLRLIDQRTFDNGIMRVRYAAKRS